MSLKEEEEKEEKMRELWADLLAQNPTVRDLRDVIYDIPSLHGKAMQELLAQAPLLSKGDLQMIMDIESPDSHTHKEFGRLLLEMEPTTDDLTRIIGSVPSLREEAGRMLLSCKEVDNHDIYTVIELVEELREEAWQMFLKRKPNNYELCRVIMDVEQLRGAAWQELLKTNPTNGQLLDIVKHVEPIREEAQKVLDSRTRQKDRDEIAMIMNRKREWMQDDKKSRDRRELIREMYALENER